MRLVGSNMLGLVSLDGFVYRTVDLSIFLRNVAVAGALFASFRAGDNYGFTMAWHEKQLGEQSSCQWRPGTGLSYLRKPCTCVEECRDFSAAGPPCQFCGARDVEDDHECYGVLEDR